MKNQPRVRVKICGTTSLRDAELAVESGADALGFIFYRKSPRWVSLKTARSIVQKLPPWVLRVGVFVNEDVEKVNRMAESLNLDVVQLHGDEGPAYCRKVSARLIKAARVQDESSLKPLERYPVSGYLLDSFKPNVYGGTGEVFDWKLARKAKRYGPIILAGGLNPGNVAEAIRKVRPYGVDVCSGVEQSPGKKDVKKLKAFFKAVHEAA